MGEDAVALCGMLRSVSSRMRESLAERLRAKLASEHLPAGGAGRSLDKAGTEIQREALDVVLLMRGTRADEASRRAAIEGLRAHDHHEEVASFLHYWSTLSLVAGVYAPGAADEVHTAYVDWYRGVGSRRVPNRGALTLHTLCSTAPFLALRSLTSRSLTSRSLAQRALSARTGMCVSLDSS